MRIFTSTRPLCSANRSSPKSDVLLIFATAALGAVTISVQVVFLRELLGVLYGNELIIGLLLALWMGLTGIGAYLGGKRDRKEEERGLMAASFLLLAWLPIASVSALRLLRHLIIAPGVMIPVGQAFMGAAILLTPFALYLALRSPYSFALSPDRIKTRPYRRPIPLNHWGVSSVVQRSVSFLFFAVPPLRRSTAFSSSL